MLDLKPEQMQEYLKKITSMAQSAGCKVGVKFKNKFLNSNLFRSWRQMWRLSQSRLQAYCIIATRIIFTVADAILTHLSASKIKLSLSLSLEK